jgi:hypothetical protein
MASASWSCSLVVVLAGCITALPEMKSGGGPHHSTSDDSPPAHPEPDPAPRDGFVYQGFANLPVSSDELVFDMQAKEPGNAVMFTVEHGPVELHSIRFVTRTDQAFATPERLVVDVDRPAKLAVPASAPPEARRIRVRYVLRGKPTTLRLWMLPKAGS